MIRTLLVDDELVDLEYLAKRIPWGELGLAPAVTASSGFAALRALQEQRFDILLTDIRMPIMSGLELAAKARELHPSIQVIIVTGHEDFKYAKQAIQLQAVDYLLKPVHIPELAELLKASSEQIKERTSYHSDKQQLNRALPIARSGLLLRFLEGADEPDPALLASYRLSAGPHFCALIELDDVRWKTSLFPEHAFRTLAEDTVGLLLRYLHDRFGGIAARIGDHQVACILPERDKAGLPRILAHVAAHTSMTATISQGSAAERPEQLPSSYAEAKQLMRYKMFLGKNRILDSSSARPQIQEQAVDLDEKAEALFQAVIHYRLVAIDDCLIELFGFINRLESHATVYNVTLYVLTRMDQFLKRFGENLFELMQWSFRSLDALYQFETTGDIQSWLRRSMFECSERFRLKKQNRNRKIIEDMMAYVGQHLESKTTLKDVAEVFSFSPNYLGQLFKEETGMHFSDFLVRKRMEKATEYLSDPSLKIYEITERVGYKNIIYFNRQFKEFYGMTPSEYRKKAGV